MARENYWNRLRLVEQTIATLSERSDTGRRDIEALVNRLSAESAALSDVEKRLVRVETRLDDIEKRREEVRSRRWEIGKSIFVAVLGGTIALSASVLKEAVERSLNRPTSAPSRTISPPDRK